ncbi:MAG: hypothetical protein WCP92_03995 [bacterium]
MQRAPDKALFPIIQKKLHPGAKYNYISCKANVATIAPGCENCLIAIIE